MAHFGKVMVLFFAFAAVAYCAPAKDESLSEKSGKILVASFQSRLRFHDAYELVCIDISTSISRGPD